MSNTDAQALEQSLSDKRVQLGMNITKGLGAGSRPDVGKAAAEESREELLGFLRGSNMAFITAGMGGGTGTGAAPVVAKLAKEEGLLTVGVVTKPFHFEGIHRMRIAEAGIAEMAQYVDTLIVIPNQNLFRVANEKTTFADAFNMADDVLYSGVRGITDLMVMPGLINLDFADIRTVMTEMGKAMMGTGEASGENRAISAAEAAISNPLLDDVSMRGARGVLINITGGFDMTLFEVDEAANRIRDEVDTDANIIFGSTFDESMEGIIRVSIVATGIDQQSVVAKSTGLFSATPVKPDLPEVHAFDAPSALDLDRDTPNLFHEAELPLRDHPSADTTPVQDPQEAFFVPRDPARADQPMHPMTPPRASTEKRPSLFERLTSFGRSKPQEPVMPTQQAFRGHPATQAHDDLHQHPAPHAPHPSSPHEMTDDTLEIPAFLRRNKS